jgi:type VI secretion system protein ImpK
LAIENLKLIYGTGEESSFIIKYFEDFYTEVIRFKKLLLGHTTLTGEEDQDVIPAEVPSPERIITQLVEMLNNQAKDAARYGGEFAEKYYTEAQFVMAALADETFLHMAWSGKQYWENNLVESRLYNTHLSGETFFQRMDAFLKLRDPSRSDIAMIYLLALGLGFKGKYRNPADQGKLESYRRELYIFINHRDPMLLSTTVHLFPDTYLHTLSEGNVEYLNDLRPWVIIFLAVFATMLIISLAVWQINTSKTNELMDSIFALTRK